MRLFLYWLFRRHSTFIVLTITLIQSFFMYLLWSHKQWLFTFYMKLLIVYLGFLTLWSITIIVFLTIYFRFIITMVLTFDIGTFNTIILIFPGLINFTSIEIIFIHHFLIVIRSFICGLISVALLRYFLNWGIVRVWLNVNGFAALNAWIRLFFSLGFKLLT